MYLYMRFKNNYIIEQQAPYSKTKLIRNGHTEPVVDAQLLKPIKQMLYGEISPYYLNKYYKNFPKL